MPFNFSLGASLRFAPIAFLFLLSGCIPFLSNETQSRLWLSLEDRVNSYKKYLDSQIGKEFLATVGFDVWCETNSCKINGDGTFELIEKQIDKNDQNRVCIISWTSDQKQSMGNYVIENKLLYYGFGKKLFWQYKSPPENCVTTINFKGPW